MKPERAHRIFALLLGSTGVFAIASALYTWGDGVLWQQTELTHVLIPWGDLLVAGPVALLAAFGLWYQKRWGRLLGMFSAGIFIFGSVLVGVMLLWQGWPFHWKLVFPALTGMGIGIAFVLWVLRHDSRSD